MGKNTLFSVLAATLIMMAGPSFAAEAKVPMAQLCGNCHKPEQGIMMGFLENISLKAGTLQMNFLSHKEVVKFDAKTALKNVTSLEDIRNYTNKGFSVHFIEKDGEKLATAITRFDVLKTIEQGEYKVEKLSLEQFKQGMQAKKAIVYDVRPPLQYTASHIPGAIPLPAPAFEKFKDKLPQDKTTPIILYDAGGCLSPTVAFNLKGMGYENVSIFTPGFPAWAKSDFGMTTADWLKQAIKEGIPHVLVDLRTADEVAKGHVPGAVSIPYQNLASMREKFPVQKDAPVILYGPDNEKAAQEIIAWGYRDVRVLQGEIDQWKTAGNPVASGDARSIITYVPKPKPGTVSIADFEKTAAGGEQGKVLVDVRNPDEVAQGKIKNSLNIPADQIGSRSSELPSDKEVLLFCPTGVRAEMAYNILQKKDVASRYLDANISIAEDGSFEIKEK
jgi:rhodanese-related sulfurtransferase